jgi:electron transport complex protein RnfD
MPSPHIASGASVSRVMLIVLLALLPGIAVYAWTYGAALFIQIVLASATALAAEAAMLKLRGRPARPALADLSALVTAWLLALSLPPLLPWWITVSGTLIAIVVAKHVYGGLGQNLFNPAMVGFAALIVSFPVQMTQWPAPHALATAAPGFGDAAAWIFSGALPEGAAPDAVTMATPLDAMRTWLREQHTVSETLTQAIFGRWGGTGSEWIAGAYLLGGLALLALRIMPWHVPLAFLAGVWVVSVTLYLLDSDRYVSPFFHLAAPSTMLCAFFIATDPVSGCNTPRGRLIFGAAAGMLTVVIRTWGGYPDGVAFSILLLNVMAPFIDTHTMPRVFGTAKR